MKRMFILACFVLLFLSVSVQAQKYKKFYKKAYELANQDLDSAFIMAKKAVKLAKSAKSKYKSYYLLGWIANKKCYYDFSLEAYKKAKANSSVKKEMVNTDLAIAMMYFSAGNYEKASTAARKAISFWRETEDTNGLSYSYDILGRVLAEKGDKEAIPTLKDALRIRLESSVKESAYSHESLALAYFTFGEYHKAAKHQGFANKSYPIKTISQDAYNKATLAKYLAFSGKMKKAKKVIEMIKLKDLGQKAQLFVIHSRSILRQIRQPETDQYVLLDSLLQQQIKKEHGIIEKQAIARKAVKMYEDILLCKLTEQLAIKYRKRLSIVNMLLVNFSRETSKSDQQQLALAFGEKPSFSYLPQTIGLLAILLAFIYTLYVNQVRKKNKLSPGQAQFIRENNLVATLQRKMERPLTDEEQEITIQMFRGKTFKQLAEHFRKSKDTIKTKAGKIARDAKIKSLFTFVTEFRDEEIRKQ